MNKETLTCTIKFIKNHIVLVGLYFVFDTLFFLTVRLVLSGICTELTLNDMCLT